MEGVKLNEEVLRGASRGDIRRLSGQRQVSLPDHLYRLLSSSRMNNRYPSRTPGGEGVCGPSPAYDISGSWYSGEEWDFEN
jgi:hypothetical protein